MAAPRRWCGSRWKPPPLRTTAMSMNIRPWSASRMPCQPISRCIVADRGFGDQKLYRFLTEQLKFDYVIRFRGNITVTSVDGDVRTAAGWVGPGGRATVLRGAL